MLTDNENTVYDKMRADVQKGKNPTTRGVASETGLPYSSVCNAIARLKELGYLTLQENPKAWITHKPSSYEVNDMLLHAMVFLREFKNGNPLTQTGKEELGNLLKDIENYQKL